MNVFSALMSKFARRSFDHDAAQKYEANHARQWLNANFLALYDQIVSSKADATRWPGPENLIVKEFFDSNMDEWDSFAEFISDKTCLDIGCGPCSLLCIWYWVKEKIVIDPLISQYDSIAKELFGKSWFGNDIRMYSLIGESYIPELENKIDGAIVCRNALDHCDNPYQVLENVSKYAAPGCYLLLWTDLYHKHGVDEGHSNITKSSVDFEAQIKQLGFEIVRRVGNIRNDDSTINYGCLAKKTGD